MIKIFEINSSLRVSENNKYELTKDIEDANFLFFTYKIRSKQDKINYIGENSIPIVSDAIRLSRKYKKKLVYLCGGDRPPVILPNIENILVLNTSVSRSKKASNEMVIGVSLPDKFKYYLLNPKLSIGFVGQKLHNREKYLHYLSNSGITTDFILRDAYIHKLKNRHILDFENNMNSNLFTFCYRGAGNFSVRFYETLMRGRIPIVIKTDNIFPFEEWINYNRVGLFIEETDLNENMNLEEQINNFYYSRSKEELIDMQKYNRQIYLTYFKESVFFEKIFEYIERY